MPFINLYESGSDVIDTLVAADVCIVGTGPAGATLATELSGAGRRVVLLESGAVTRTAAADELDEIVNVGRARHPDQWSVRNRILGGSSHTWGGRCAPLDEIDFAKRAWVPDSGWPFGPAEMLPYLDRSADHLGLAVGAGFSGDSFWELAGLRPPSESIDRSTLLPFFWQFSRDHRESYRFEYMRFGRHLVERLGSNVTLVLGATVLRVRAAQSGRSVAGVEVAGPDGRRRVLSSTTVVLCTGGIETPRILLASDDVVPHGLGNDRDLVGRYLMDHLRGDLGTFGVAGTDSLQRRLGRYNVAGRLFRAGLRLSPDIQEAEGLLNCAVWLGEEVASDDPWDALMRLMLRTADVPTDLRRIVSGRQVMVRGLVDYFVKSNGVPRKYDALNLVGMCEQRPDPDSRVVLADRSDAFGMRLPQVDWRSHPDEARTLIRTAEVVRAQLTAAGYPAPELADWVSGHAPVPESFVDVAHPTGTTRMAVGPDRGVVDPNCQVHGVAGLYVVGSAVFPTGGHCNPTQMIVAMAVRLGDRLLAERTSVEVGQRSKKSGDLVLVTGATGRIGRIVVSRLLDEGYAVRAVSRGTSRFDPRIDERIVDLRTATRDDYDRLLDGCRHVVHLAAELGNAARMDDVNVSATGALAAAAERLRIGSFCYTSSVAVYGSSLQAIADEESPVLTPNRDVRNEYWALDYVRKYGRTKLAGEMALRSVAAGVRYTILRPTVVVDTDQLRSLREWSWLRKTLIAHRPTHHVYVGDLADAITWSLRRAESETSAPGTVEHFNFSDDDGERATFADYFRYAYRTTNDRRYRTVTSPAIFDWLRDFARYRASPRRRPLWRMHFPARRITESGFIPRYGMKFVEQRSVSDESVHSVGAVSAVSHSR